MQSYLKNICRCSIQAKGVWKQ